MPTAQQQGKRGRFFIRLKKSGKHIGDVWLNVDHIVALEEIGSAGHTYTRIHCSYCGANGSFVDVIETTDQILDQIPPAESRP